MVALVAALAALAAAGRVALSPIPNVVPTTDITLIAGFALGGAPGFAVGALAALASNFWLGQGPWTPWQMAGWGMAGLLGAGLAALTGRRLGRVGLAVACGLAGFAYGALLDLSLMVSYGGEQSLDRYLALSARGLPFNIAHARRQRRLRPDRRPRAGADADALPHPLRVRVGRAKPAAGDAVGRRGAVAGACLAAGRRRRDRGAASIGRAPSRPRQSRRRRARTRSPTSARPRTTTAASASRPTLPPAPG